MGRRNLMRKAEIDKAWAACRGRRPTLDLREVITKTSGQYQVLRFPSRVIGIVGSNGAGKTSWLEQIFSHYKGTALKARKALTIIRVGGLYRGEFLALPAHEAPWPQRSLPATQYINVANEVNVFINYSKGLDNFDELLPQAGAKVATPSELGRFRHVLQKNYSRIETYELEHPHDPDDTFPHFVVATAEDKYDSFSMGFGELCSCYIIWLCSRASKGAILLLDEPDSHLSPRARKAMLDFLAVVASERHLQILFSSHAAETVTYLNQDEILYFSENGQPTISQSLQKHVALRNLGLKSKPRLLVLAEDVDAQELLLQIWSRWGREYQTIVEIKIMQGGAAELARIQRLFPNDSTICTLQIILDGDKRNDYQGQNIIFLPGVDDPIVSAKQSALDHIENFSNFLGVNIDALRESMESIQYCDHHDYCSLLSERLETQGIDTKRVRADLFKTWLSDVDNCKDGKLLAEEIILKAIPLA
jgi:predicted ATPase